MNRSRRLDGCGHSHRLTTSCVKRGVDEIRFSPGGDDDVFMKNPLTVRTIVSHELRTPLTVIVAGVDLLGSSELDANLRPSIREGVRRATRRLQEIVAVAEAVAEGYPIFLPETGGSSDSLTAAAALVAACSGLAQRT